MPGGPVKRTIKYVAPFDKCDREQDYETARTIKYVAPFDKCDREQDYETAWRFFEEKFKN